MSGSAEDTPQAAPMNKSSHRGHIMESMFAKYVKIGTVVATYWFVSITMVFVNKYLLSSPELKLSAPFFVTWFQCVVTVGLCVLLRFFSTYFPDKLNFPPVEIDLKLNRATLPLSVVFVSMISFNNLCLMYVGVAFYYIGRSLTTVFNVALSKTMLGQSTSCKAMLCCGVIIGGFLLGVDQESTLGSFSFMGVAFGVLASASVAMNSIYTKKVLPMLDNNVWRLTYYNNLNACVLFLPLMICFGEINVIMSFEHFGNSTFWFYMLMGGVFGFAIGYVTGLQIQVTSPLTHNISGTAKACAQTVIACFYFSDEKPWLWWTSNLVVLLGSGAYTEVKRNEMKQQHTEAIKDLAKSVEIEEGDDSKSLLIKP